MQTLVTAGGQTQVRMVTQTGPRPGQTTITRHQAPVRIQGQRLVNASGAHIRPGTTIVQTNNMQQSTPPALQPVSFNSPQTVFNPAVQVIFIILSHFDLYQSTLFCFLLDSIVS